MANFIYQTPGCMPLEVYRLYQRILAAFLVGNSDAHLKNFAMFHTAQGYRLTPLYDCVAAAIFPEYSDSALIIAGIKNSRLVKLEFKHLLMLGKNFGLSEAAVYKAIENLGKQLPIAINAIENSLVGTKKLRQKLINWMERRWNESFQSTGRYSLKKRNTDASSKK